MPFGVCSAVAVRRIVGAGLEPLRSNDLRAVLDFVETAWALAGDCAFTSETLGSLNELIPCDELSYCELDRLGRRTIEYFDSDGGEGGDGRATSSSRAQAATSPPVTARCSSWSGPISPHTLGRTAARRGGARLRAG